MTLIPKSFFLRWSCIHRERATAFLSRSSPETRINRPLVTDSDGSIRVMPNLAPESGRAARNALMASLRLASSLTLDREIAAVLGTRMRFAAQVPAPFLLLEDLGLEPAFSKPPLREGGLAAALAWAFACRFSLLPTTLAQEPGPAATGSPDWA